MTPINNFPSPMPPGLNTAIEAQGILLVNEGGVWMANDAAAAEAVIASYDPAPYIAERLRESAKEFRENREALGLLFQPANAARSFRFVADVRTQAALSTHIAGDELAVWWKVAEPGSVFVLMTKPDMVALRKAIATHLADIYAEERNTVAGA